MNRFFTIVSLIFLIGCNSGNNSSDVSNAEKAAQPVAINQQLPNNVSDWVTKGVEGYGIIISELNPSKTLAKAVKIKVISIRSDQIKVKALETVSLNASAGCDKLGISYGETWWEKDGDIFKTKAEAEQKIKAKKWLLK